MLIAFVILYLLATLLIGFWAARRVKNAADFAVAGRKLPLVIAGSALFATWFGSETVMGAPAEFVEGGLLSVMEDPFGAALCLILVGLLVARPLYRLNILTFNDYYRMRFGRVVEVVSAIALVPSYLGWIAAQMMAMAILLNALAGIPMFWGIQICMAIVVLYTFVGGMWAVSITDFVQTIMIIIGILALAFEVGSQAGGVEAVLAAQPEGFFRFFPENNSMHDWAHYIAAWMTIGLGSIPQQDVFQRVNASKDEKTAVRSGYFGGIMYLTVGFIPLFIGLCAKQLHPELLEGDPQYLLPLMSLKYSSLLVQVLFFGALISAILSTTSGAILAPATVIGENLIRPMVPGMSDKQLLLTMRIAVVGVALVSMLLSLSSESIFDLVGQSSAISLVSLFVPLMAGLYWKRANGLGALFSILIGLAVWTVCEFFLHTEIPSLLYGLAASVLAMLIGSYLPGKWVGSNTAQH
ncbi:MAG: sodium:solute symporter family protein [Saprospiraceae bacterium]|nr:sodium:solute symporter family protein [Saprospiraceae bacterium]